MAFSPPHVLHHLPVYRADDFRVCCGAYEGDGMTFATGLMLDDEYMLAHGLEQQTLSLRQSGGIYTVASGSHSGRESADVYLDCAATFMTDLRVVVQILVLVETDAKNCVKQIHLVPLTPLRPKQTYRLIEISTDEMEEHLRALSRLSFGLDTQITMSCGAERAIQDLQAGDTVQTRDNGVQPIREIVQKTRRAIGHFAPVQIAAHILDDQRGDTIDKTPTVNMQSGYVEHFELRFDAPQIIFADGVAAQAPNLDGLVPQTPAKALLECLTPAAILAEELDDLDAYVEMIRRPPVAGPRRRASKG